MKIIKVATRSSPLAMWQARHVAALLEKSGMTVELLPVETTGDKKLEVALSKIGDKGVFTLELEQMLLRGEADIAVHSAKDMPSSLPDGLQIIAFTERENPQDVLLSHKAGINLDNQEITVGTASTRRVATLARYYPIVKTTAVRGNLQTRIRKMEEGACDALLLAYAGVHRMGFAGMIRQNLHTDVFTPAVGQGSLAIEAATGLNPQVIALMANALSDPVTQICVEAERAFLRAMEGGCSVPVFGYARKENGKLLLQGGIVSLDGAEEIRMKAETEWPLQGGNQHREMGKQLAESILNGGGASILSKIKQTLHS